jgi:hypothetical protein
MSLEVWTKDLISKNKRKRSRVPIRNPSLLAHLKDNSKNPRFVLPVGCMSFTCVVFVVMHVHAHARMLLGQPRHGLQNSHDVYRVERGADLLADLSGRDREISVGVNVHGVGDNST